MNGAILEFKRLLFRLPDLRPCSLCHLVTINWVQYKMHTDVRAGEQVFSFESDFLTVCEHCRTTTWGGVLLAREPGVAPFHVGLDGNTLLVEGAGPDR